MTGAVGLIGNTNEQGLWKGPVVLRQTLKLIDMIFSLTFVKVSLHRVSPLSWSTLEHSDRASASRLVNKFPLPRRSNISLLSLLQFD